MDEEVPHFSSREEENQYWKETALRYKGKVENLEKEFLEFQDSSKELERELERSLEHADKTNRDLKTKCNRLTLDLDLCREKYEQHCYESNKQIAELQKQIAEYIQNKEKLIKSIRELEQKNDDLARSERVMSETVKDIQTKLNGAIERNALLETELDERETLKAMVQRLKDDQRDLQQELNRQQLQSIPDNSRVTEKMRGSVDSNKLSMDINMTAPMKNGSSVRQMSPPNRISAINLVGDLLRKVGSIESKLAASRISKDINDSPTRESYRKRFKNWLIVVAAILIWVFVQVFFILDTKSKTKPWNFFTNLSKQHCKNVE